MEASTASAPEFLLAYSGLALGPAEKDNERRARAVDAPKEEGVERLVGHQRLQLLHELELRLVEPNVDLGVDDGSALVLSRLGHLGVAVACCGREQSCKPTEAVPEQKNNLPRLVTPIPEVKSIIWRPVSVVM